MVIKINGKKVIAAATVAVIFVMLLGLFLLMGGEKEHDNVNTSDAVQAAAIKPQELIKEDFFIEYRIERERLRAAQQELLEENLKESQKDAERREARDKLLTLFNERKLESDMESMIRAKGFSDAVVILSGESVNAIIKAASLKQNDAARIADVIKRAANIKEENIVISTK
jgi:stage III sporulation protein AH